MWLKCSLCSKNCFFTLLSAIFFELSITRTFFRFPLKVRVIGSRLYVHIHAVSWLYFTVTFHFAVNLFCFAVALVDHRRIINLLILIFSAKKYLEKWTLLGGKCWFNWLDREIDLFWTVRERKNTQSPVFGEWENWHECRTEKSKNKCSSWNIKPKEG